MDDAAERFFAGRALGLAVFRAVRATLDATGPVEVTVSKSQVAFRRRRGFAYLWVPGQYLRKPGAEVVLSMVLGRRDDSPRFKEVAHPSRDVWMHHLEIHGIDDLDAEVTAWLREAYAHAA